MKLSVCLITYNHEAYIERALQSVLEQKTSFDFEIVIGEDNSKDKTRYFCEDIARKYPGRIKLLAPCANLGMMENFLRTLAACKGQFIAFLEGDDYWTDPQKLEKQVSLLESDPTLSACFHNVLAKYMRTGENTERPFHQNLEKDLFETEDLLAQWFIPTASVVFVHYNDFEIPEWFRHCKSGDIPFLLLLSLRGKIRYINSIMSVYRIHDQGMSATHHGYNKIVSMIYIYESFNIHSNFRFHKKIREAEIYEIDRHYPKPAIAKPETSQKPATTSKLSKRISGKLKKVLGLD
jgi:glycosyltransferase involved in cell wall biosynthesis